MLDIPTFHCLAEFSVARRIGKMRRESAEHVMYRNIMYRAYNVQECPHLHTGLAIEERYADWPAQDEREDLHQLHLV